MITLFKARASRVSHIERHIAPPMSSALTIPVEVQRANGTRGDLIIYICKGAFTPAERRATDEELLELSKRLMVSYSESKP